jgi:Tol biopolymer transport system component
MISAKRLTVIIFVTLYVLFNTNSITIAQLLLSLQAMRIAFTSNRDGTEQLYLMSVDGTNVTLLPYIGGRPRFNYNVQYSLINNQIVYSKTDDLGQPTQIITTNLDGGAATTIIQERANLSVGSWSPDGSKLVFSGDREGNSEIYVIGSNGANLQRLTSNNYPDYSPVWSPDGNRIVFNSARDGNNEIYVMNSDGSNLVRLTSNVDINDHSPSWSPDGNKIVFVSDRNSGAHHIFAMNSDGSSVIQLTNSTGSNLDPSWSPDGTRIAFTSTRDGNTEIYVMNSDGSQQSRLTNNLVSDGEPSWVPSEKSQTGRGLRGAYYALNNLTGIRFFRLNSQINFNWAASSPEPNIRSQAAVIPVDNFSVRWTGFIEPLYTEAYTFFVNRNDGARLWVNGQQIINAWTNTTNAVETASTAITLTAGVRVPITLEYYEATGNAQVSLSWQSARQTKQIVPTSALYPPEDSGSIPEVSP